MGESHHQQEHTAGLSNTEFEALMASLTEGGLRDKNDAKISLKVMVMSLQAPTGASLETIQRLKLSVRNPAGQLHPMGSILIDLRRKTAGMSEHKRVSTLLNLFGTDGIRAARILIESHNKPLDNMEII